MDVFWFLPTHGDGHYLGTTQGARPVTLNYLKQVAQAADNLGYHGVLIPTGRSREDSWVIASILVPLTERLRYLVAIRPGIISARIKEYADLGIESFIFSGYPHLEEAYRFAERVFPLLPAPYASLAGRGITNLSGPFGEMIANDVLPTQAGA